VISAVDITKPLISYRTIFRVFPCHRTKRRIHRGVEHKRIQRQRLKQDLPAVLGFETETLEFVMALLVRDFSLAVLLLL
jgi:hypothetical protein